MERGWQEAEAVAEIVRLKARYFRFMDLKLWDEWEQVFAPDATMDMRGEGETIALLGGRPGRLAGPWQGAAHIRATTSASLEGIVTVHHGHMPEIELVSPTAATGVWAMEDMLVLPPGQSIGGFRGYGHYHDTYSRIDGRWTIQSTRLTRLAVRSF